MKHDKTIFVFGLLFIILMSGLSGFLYYLSVKKTEINTTNLVKKETKNVVIPTAKLVANDYKNNEIVVLNATGISGAAKKYADKLKTLGYTKVSTGNNIDKLSKNKLLAPTDFREDLVKIDFLDYEYEKNESIKIIIGNIK